MIGNYHFKGSNCLHANAGIHMHVRNNIYLCPLGPARPKMSLMRVFRVPPSLLPDYPAAWLMCRIDGHNPGLEIP